MENSILKSIKKRIGFESAYTAFDDQLIDSINTVFSTLKQLGVGPTSGFSISGNDEEWSEFIDDDSLNFVKSYIYLKVRLEFDIPDTSFVIDAIKNQITELEWRLNLEHERSISP